MIPLWDTKSINLPLYSTATRHPSHTYVSDPGVLSTLPYLRYGIGLLGRGPSKTEQNCLVWLNFPQDAHGSEFKSNALARRPVLQEYSILILPPRRITMNVNVNQIKSKRFEFGVALFPTCFISYPYTCNHSVPNKPRWKSLEWVGRRTDPLII